MILLIPYIALKCTQSCLPAYSEVACTPTSLGPIPYILLPYHTEFISGFAPRGDRINVVPKL